MADWSPATYLKFEDERTRAAIDLLAHVPLDDARHVVDVGCGPGNSTELLAARYPGADVLGIDNSPAMLEEARRRLPEARFEPADAAAWLPDADVDLVFANATYQWVPDHFAQLPRVLAALRPGAVLAVQMPDNRAEPTHRLMVEVADQRPLGGAARPRLPRAAAAGRRLLRRARPARRTLRHLAHRLPAPPGRRGRHRRVRPLDRPAPVPRRAGRE